jgi:hypothetical protein
MPLKGTGLEIRELARELVISNPGHPGQGRIYVTYATGEVSHRRVVWDYLGCIDGHGNDDEKAELSVNAEKFISVLTARNSGSLWLPVRACCALFGGDLRVTARGTARARIPHARGVRNAGREPVRNRSAVTAERKSGAHVNHVRIPRAGWPHGTRKGSPRRLPD